MKQSEGNRRVVPLPLTWKADALGRWRGGGIRALFAALFAAVIVPNNVCRPYWIKVVDKDRGIWKFKAKNPAYTRRVVGEEV